MDNEIIIIILEQIEDAFKHFQSNNQLCGEAACCGTEIFTETE